MAMQVTTRSIMMFGGISCGLGLASSAHAAVLWNESTQGDLSGNWLAPTALTLAQGSNLVRGETGADGGGVVDRDYVTLTIPAGAQLTQILLNDYFSSDQIAFVGVIAGTTMPDPDEVTSTSLLGWSLFGTADVGSDLFEELSIPRSPGGGLISPVGPGTYTFWIQQTGEGTLYEFDFVVVPAPGVAGVLALLGAVGLRRRR